MRNYLYLLLIVFTACQAPSSASEEENESINDLHSGPYVLSMDLDGAILSQYVFIDSSLSFTFHNGEEQIRTKPASQRGDTLYLEMPVYETYFQLVRQPEGGYVGSFHNPSRSSDYAIDCIFDRSEKEDWNPSPSSASTQQIYAVHFSPETEDTYPAVGKFTIDEGHATGTFETETGDYRFLSGTTSGDSLELQCFDGSHVFHFSMLATADTLIGTFRSGIHWREPFVGSPDPSATLRDPLQITEWTSSESPLFNAMDTDGELHTFTEESFSDKVTLIQLTGSWCPNCLDASEFYKELYAEYGADRFQVIPVAFERSDDYQTNALHLQSYMRELDLPYPMYLGGKASKSVAHELFPQLSDVSSFPTTLFISPSGKVVRVHTGFYGPGTGETYERYKANTRVFIDSLLGKARV